MTPNQIVNVLSYGIQLKQMARSGWLQRGVPNPENVAAHSYSMGLCALTMMSLIPKPLDQAKILAMVVLHDLPESLTSDIPSPVKRFFPAGMEDVKRQIERGALAEITQDVPFGAEWRDLWDEYQLAETAEAKFIHDVDRLELYLQAYTYEQQTGNAHLADFWTKPHRFYYEEIQAVYDWLAQNRL